MVITTQSLTGFDPSAAHDRHRERRKTLDEARTFRIEQLAGLERDLADVPTESVKRALHAAAKAALAEVDAALDRIVGGVYGLCVTCARPIPEERLDVLPMAAQCMPCHYNDQHPRSMANRSEE